MQAMVNKMKIQTKKSYNPLKMWGSWVGSLILYLINKSNIINNSFSIGNFITNPLECCFRPCGIGFFINSCRISIIILLLILTIGFLFGWLIHSLIRRFSK